MGTTPSAPLTMFWRRSGLKVVPGAEAFTGQMMERPEVAYPTEPNTLYTIIMADHGEIGEAGEVPEGIQYFHWVVENVPGTMVDLGDEVMEYVPPFGFKIDESTGTLVEDGEPLHPILTLVYKQPGRISMTTRQNGCNTDIIGNRLGFQAELAAEYGLEGPIAGNFLHTVYDKSVNSILCRMTRSPGLPSLLLLPESMTAQCVKPSWGRGGEHII